MPREPSKVDGSEMEGGRAVSLVQQIDIGYVASYRLFGSLNAFRTHAVNTPAKKARVARKKELAYDVGGAKCCLGMLVNATHHSRVCYLGIHNTKNQNHVTRIGCPVFGLN